MNEEPPSGAPRAVQATANSVEGSSGAGRAPIDVEGGASALPTRLSRYGNARRRAIENLRHLDAVANDLGGLPRGLDAAARTADRLRDCGNWLAFRHYWSVDQVRLHRASLCRQHLVCPLCAIRRSSKMVGAYLDRFQAIRLDQPQLRPVMLTYTVRNGPDLAERMDHLRRGLRTLTERRRNARTRAKSQDCTWRHVAGAVGALEATWKAETGWHPHLHMIALCDGWMAQKAMSREWASITGDSFVVGIQALDLADPAKGFVEALKYSVKFSGMEPAQVWEAAQALKGQRLVASLGCFRGVQVPEELLDEPLEDLPFNELFYRYIGSGAYSLSNPRPPELP